MYKSVTIKPDQAYLIRKNNRGWLWFCQSVRGICYWNGITGEIMWIDEKLNEVTFQQKKI